MSCKHLIDLGWRTGSRNCERKAVRDGYCTRHHPDYVSPATKSALAEYEREEKDPVYRAEKWLEDAKKRQQQAFAALREAQDECALANAERVECEDRLTRLKHPGLFPEKKATGA